MLQGSFWEANISSPILETLYGIRLFVTAFTRASPIFPLLYQLKEIHDLLSYIFEIRIIAILLNTPDPWKNIMLHI